ncbi:Orotate phosphoribosyltransferase [bioreactor metagenome]|uniref:orotate phosphoribosyltransferase n=1 Tax=bioreactor metagenome TaxID=1076179 RepID=A0A645B322_9ZZZZ
MLTKEQIIDILKEAGAFLEGHFLLTSGRHSDKYVQCAKVFLDAKYSEPICKEIADHFRDDNVDIVIGPAMGAVQLAYEVGRQLGCRNFFTEREDGKMTLRRGFAVEPGEHVLVVEDVVTTGGSAKEVIEIVKAAGGIVVGVGSVIDRTGGTMDFGVPFRPALSMEVISWAADECPLCRQGLPYVKPGSRKKS